MKKFNIGGVFFNSKIQEKFITPNYQREYQQVKKAHNRINLADQERNKFETMYNPIKRQINPMNYPMGNVTKQYNYSQSRDANPIPYSINNKKPVVNPMNYPVELGGKKNKPIHKTVHKTVKKTVKKPVRKTMKK